MERRTLVTGSSGFVGRNVCPVLQRMGWNIRRVVRTSAGNDPGASDVVEIGDITAKTDWSEALNGVNSVVHLAARVHLPGDTDAAAFYRTNTDATLRLAEASARAGVRRFVYLSTAKVMGEGSPDAHPFSELDAPCPADAYARSKLEAEAGLREFAGMMDVVILRPPLVYGPSVGANFLRLLQSVDRGAWLPFGAVTNRRSLLYVGNLSSAIAACLQHPAAAGATFLVSDGEDVSTADLIRRIAIALGKPVRCPRVPPSLLSFVASVAGRRQEARRLLGSLEIDSRLIRDRLGWTAPYTVDEGLAATAAWYRTVQ